MSLASSLCLWEPWVNPRSRNMGSCSASTWQTLPTFSSSHLTSVTGVGTALPSFCAIILPFKMCSFSDVCVLLCWCVCVILCSVLMFLNVTVYIDVFYEGQRFRYTYYDESQGEIYRSIEHLDKMVTTEMYLIQMWWLVKTHFCRVMSP